MKKKNDLYKTLGVSPDAPQDEIKKAFRKKAKGCHPDHHQGDAAKENEFKEISTAYKVLADPGSRRRYDTSGDTEDPVHHVRQEAMSMAIGVVSEMVASLGDRIFSADLFKDCEASLTAAGKKRIGEIKRNKQIAKKVEKLVTKIKHRDGEHSLIVQALITQKNQLLQNNKQIKLQIRIVQNARRIIREYQFEKEIATDMRQGTRMGFAMSPFFSAYMGG